MALYVISSPCSCTALFAPTEMRLIFWPDAPPKYCGSETKKLDFSPSRRVSELFTGGNIQLECSGSIWPISTNLHIFNFHVAG